MISSYIEALRADSEPSAVADPPEVRLRAWWTKDGRWRIFTLWELLDAMRVERNALIGALHSCGWRRVKIQRAGLVRQGWVPPVTWLPE